MGEAISFFFWVLMFVLGASVVWMQKYLVSRKNLDRSFRIFLLFVGIGFVSMAGFVFSDIKNELYFLHSSASEKKEEKSFQFEDRKNILLIESVSDSVFSLNNLFHSGKNSENRTFRLILKNADNGTVYLKYIIGTSYKILKITENLVWIFQKGLHGTEGIICLEMRFGLKVLDKTDRSSAVFPLKSEDGNIWTVEWDAKKNKTGSGLQISAYNPSTAKPIDIQKVLSAKYPSVNSPVRSFRFIQDKSSAGGDSDLYELSGIQVRSENGNEFTIQL
ncbi:MAG TPA: hypothetical protein PL169_11480 [Leptospiraceae bacterium]|nr:hypothetical protein [Leptospiraceae bacterium]